MTWFYQLFPKFREASDARLEMQGQNHTLRGEVENLREEVRKARDAERTAYQMLINVDYQLRFGFAPFVDAPRMPEHKVQHDNGGAMDPGMISGQDLMRDGRDAAIREFSAYMDNALGRGARG